MPRGARPALGRLRGLYGIAHILAARDAGMAQQMGGFAPDRYRIAAIGPRLFAPDIQLCGPVDAVHGATAIALKGADLF